VKRYTINACFDNIKNDIVCGFSDELCFFIVFSLSFILLLEEETSLAEALILDAAFLADFCLLLRPSVQASTNYWYCTLHQLTTTWPWLILKTPSSVNSMPNCTGGNVPRRTTRAWHCRRRWISTRIRTEVPSRLISWRSLELRFIWRSMSVSTFRYCDRGHMQMQSKSDWSKSQYEKQRCLLNRDENGRLYYLTLNNGSSGLALFGNIGPGSAHGADAHIRLHGRAECHSKAGMSELDPGSDSAWGAEQCVWLRMCPCLWGELRLWRRTRWYRSLIPTGRTNWWYFYWQSLQPCRRGATTNNIARWRASAWPWSYWPPAWDRVPGALWNGSLSNPTLMRMSILPLRRWMLAMMSTSWYDKRRWGQEVGLCHVHMLCSRSRRTNNIMLY